MWRRSTTYWQSSITGATRFVIEKQGDTLLINLHVWNQYRVKTYQAQIPADVELFTSMEKQEELIRSMVNADQSAG